MEITMRMWMINPKMLCRQHLLGEHGELHKWLPWFEKGRKVHGRFYPVVQIQFNGYKERHDLLALELLLRGWNHGSPIKKVPDFKTMYPEYYNLKVDKEISISTLMDRCDKCRERILRRI
jgi:hypothetical protein